MNVLCVPDDESVVGPTERALERGHAAFRIVTESRVDEGLARIESGPVDCVVSVADGTSADGLDVLETVREDYPDLPVILLTDTTDEAATSEAIAAGVTDCFRTDGGEDRADLLANRIENAVRASHRDRDVGVTMERFDRLLEYPADVVIATDADGIVDYVTPSVERILGYEPAAVRGTNLAELVHPDDRDALSADVTDLAGSDGAETSVEFRARHADGDWRWFDARGRNLTGDGGVEGVVLNVCDVTERIQQERELEIRSEALETSIDGMAILDEEGVYRFVNQAHAEVYGYDDPDAFVGETWQKCYDDEEAARHEREIMPKLAEEGSWRGEAVGKRKDGSTFPQEVSLTALADGSLICVVRDITERTEREDALRETNRQLESILDTTSAAVFIKEADGRYQLMNERCRNLLDLGDMDVVGCTDYDLFPEPVADRFRADDERVLEAGETLEIEEEIPTPDGTRTFLTLKSPVEVDGEPDGICAVSTDITERVAYKREMERQNERLEEFASVISHDLRNPLNVADGHIEMARMETDSEHLAKASDALERMESIVDGVLTLTRKGENVVEPDPVEVATVAEEAWTMVETGEAELTVEEVGSLPADRDRLMRLFENLFRNATEHGGTGVAVEVGPIDADSREGGPDGPPTGGFYVADDGAGIPPDIRDGVFEPGFSTAEEGTGIGLSIVEQIAEAHGWTVDVTESEAGGARFEFRDGR